MTEEQKWQHSPEPQNDVVVLDAKGLRALAHPVRVQLVGLLRRHGPSTATRLAERMGLTSGATSYHLRQLAAAGFVAEDTERGNARERWWKPLHQMTWFADRDLADEEPEAALSYLRSVVAANALTTQRALNSFETMPREWRHSFDFSDWSLLLTPEEARRLADEVAEVVGRYRRAPGTGSGSEPASGACSESDSGSASESESGAVSESALGAVPEGAERVAVVFQVLPDPASGPEADESEGRS
ncbi:helix-turn-helix transcriptional regulator [Kitasatospora sp. RG8]|uniref:ArsR/SmtB family transcription factor n=1 Tax=Kitasatospora sp. RG8 TaxID=2820815 RepID=UPI001ADF3A73|nr:helix-turn-helix domain-containing protein [Kitasatospora sp. RG8]MBP0450911.1 helix-turn-helix transcriptional regulator [Kitasatospora sp. RG8]